MPIQSDQHMHQYLPSHQQQPQQPQQQSQLIQQTPPPIQQPQQQQPQITQVQRMGQPTLQQKRQNSMSNYMVNSSNKRLPIQMSMNMQSPHDYMYNSPSSALNTPHNNFDLTQNLISAPTSPHVSSPRYNNSLGRINDMRRNLVQQQQQQHKTPTPSAYEIPSSPNINPMSNFSIQNHSDSPDSTPAADPAAKIQLDKSQEISMINNDSSFVSSGNVRQPLQSLQLQQQASLVPMSQDQSDQGGVSTAQQQNRIMSEDEQKLATKLKETYKMIVTYEEIVQKSCVDITMKINQASNGNGNNIPYGNQFTGNSNSSSSILSNQSKTSELSNDLWTVYHSNVTLLDNYYDFLITALKPSANQNQFKTGKSIVDLYKIPRRMWVYGIVGFLEVLKNIITIFQDHEICLCFIAFCFNIISNLTDPAFEMEGWWCEKLGDLSRMAIALYSSRFIDWKISAEYWYSIAMKTLYGHGKIYYHMCTVQQDNLDALVNIGKAVICRDPFVPTQQYLKLVVDNICTQRNILTLLELPIIDFIKIHKVLLSIHNPNSNNSQIVKLENEDNIHDTQLQYGIDLVTRYGLTFGSDSNGYNFFTRASYTPSGIINDPHNPYYMQQQQSGTANTIEKMNFWFNKGPLFAIANINHLVGLGDAKNPFAKIFQLPEALKERKDKKDKKRKSKSGTSVQEQEELKDFASSGTNFANSGVDGLTVSASDLSINDWFYCLNYINKSVLELSFRILNNYLVGPKQASTSHVIVWLYFLISVGEAINKFPNSQNMFLWLFRKLFPWDSFINYLNSLVTVTKNNVKHNELCRKYLIYHPNYIQHFNNHEFLPEVWKCWGTLWFDYVAAKDDYNDFEAAGVSNANIFDLPVCGTSPIVNMTNEKKSREQLEQVNDERIVRIVLLARFLADNYKFGLVRTSEGFKFDSAIYNDADLLVNMGVHQNNILYSYIEDFMFSDTRFVQTNFLIPMSPANLVDSKMMGQMSPEEKDEHWFKISQQGNPNNDEEIVELGDDIADEEELDGYADSELDEEDSEYGQQNNHRHEDHMQQHHIYHQNQHQQALQQAHGGGAGIGDVYYNDNFIIGSNPMQSITGGGNEIQIFGDLGELMDSNITYITLDTNIWLKHCGRIFKCIRNKIFKISIPLIVFQELRSLRKLAEATIADAATRSVIIIRELFLTNEIVPLRFDGTVANDINETTEFENNSNWRTSVDETILNSVNEHDEIWKKLMKGVNMVLNGPPNNNDEIIRLNPKTAKVFRYCILVTDDRNMRLRAKTIGLSSFQSKWLFGQLEVIFGDRCID
ncbi:hypothetical protein HYPBUDRAFT_153913 [Hyphopichia burtonii NRRL Y-1933]|uniref:PIN domain-containing protein n=1 Tax=Hyphopichia burtonii NRRL Y-1933 TaxID=984485 RepID=A0A1E4RET8_9ASCO|nr:hypothetical protein HYPBUDRAFT_153913 [Hyphopichia burtonii NRRL Y-1933]ODV65761.1 hypothetical protein HYPBUDRAFT_153913 [Hyphopichia burtonii NRRL Y-1933]